MKFTLSECLHFPHLIILCVAKINIKDEDAYGPKRPASVACQAGKETSRK